jgi:hypothetical protein
MLAFFCDFEFQLSPFSLRKNQIKFFILLDELVNNNQEVKEWKRKN